MLGFANVLQLGAPLRLALFGALVFSTPSTAQTFTNCNPTQGECSADTALGTSKTYDFTSGASSDWTASGAPTYDSSGASFTIAESGDAPTLTSKWYIMFGKVEVVMKAAPGAGIVSSVVLQSDDLDEIDWEWLGAQPEQVQTNFFGQGKTDMSGRSAILATSDNQDAFHTYTVEWTSTEIVWSVDGTVLRVLEATNAGGEYPQTPMVCKIGAWSGGDSSNSEGTIEWAQGPTVYSTGPFTMVVSSMSAQDYSTGSSYSYDGTTGTWESIVANGGTINGGPSGTDTASPAITSTSSGSVAPFEGTHRSESATTSTPGIGSWQPSATETGTVLSASTASTTSHFVSATSSAPASSQASCSAAAGYETVTTYDQQGFLTTMVVAAGAHTSYDQQGFPITQSASLPAACTAAATLLTAARAEVSGSHAALLQDKAASSTSASSSSAPTQASGSTGRSTVEGKTVFSCVALMVMALVL